MGPMAQDFHAAFGLGETAKRISFVDADGLFRIRCHPDSTC